LKVFFNFSLNEYSNSYLVGTKGKKEAILIDPGQITLELIELIEANNFDISSVLITHRHRAHTEGLGTLLKIYNPTIYVGSKELYDFEVVEVEDNMHLILGDIEVECIAIPGHSIDSFVYKIDNTLFTGDVLLAGKVGSANGVTEKALLLKGIKKKLLTLDERLLIFPGHGTISALKIEKMFNHELIEAMAIEDLESLSHPSIVT